MLVFTCNALETCIVFCNGIVIRGKADYVVTLLQFEGDCSHLKKLHPTSEFLDLLVAMPWHYPALDHLCFAHFFCIPGNLNLREGGIWGM